MTKKFDAVTGATKATVAVAGHPHRLTVLSDGRVAFDGPAAAQDSTATRTARITYLTSVSAYIDAGREDGLEEGAAVDVLESGTPVASLKVAYLASHQAA